MDPRARCWLHVRVSSGESSDAADDGALVGRVARLEALTDSTLTQLDVDDLLVELLARVREILDVDTAAVLLLDEQADELVARAACGIEDEVRQGVRIPLGTGFAGRIAATREAVRLDQVDSTTVANPILWEKGIKVMLGVPLMSGDDVLGVLHVGRLERRPFDEHDIELLQIVADRVAGAIQTRQLAIERAATGLLERSLLPTKLPKCPGLTFATRYVAAEELTVGGDWYDLFTLPSGQLWIVVGDVAGHGLQAAVVMGRIRSALRAYTLIDAPPERVLDLVDRKVNHFEIGTMATVACAAIDPPYDTMTLAVAGHPPPVIAAPGQPAVVGGSQDQSSHRNELRVATSFVDDDRARARFRRRVLYRRPHRAPRRISRRRLRTPATSDVARPTPTTSPARSCATSSATPSREMTSRWSSCAAPDRPGKRPITFGRRL